MLPSGARAAPSPADGRRVARAVLPLVAGRSGRELRHARAVAGAVEPGTASNRLRVGEARLALAEIGVAETVTVPVAPRPFRADLRRTRFTDRGPRHASAVPTDLVGPL